MLAAVALGSVSSFAGKDSAWHFQNSVRIGHDNNIYQSRDANQQESVFVTDIINISGKMNFSSRSDMTLFWQPEFRYTVDMDPEFATYQDLYAQFNHALSQRTFLTLSDRFRYQAKDGQSDLGASENQNFLENDLMGALDFTLNAKSQIKVGAGYEFRTWDDSGYGRWDTTDPSSGNDFNQIKADGSYVRELHKDTTHASLGVNYMNHEYDGSRGGFDSTTIYGGVDHNFNPNMLGNLQLGYSFSTVDGSSGSSDSSSPFLRTGLEYNPTERTSINGTLGYALRMSQNSYYNASEEFSMGLGLRQELTGKISLSLALLYVHSVYDSSYASRGGFDDAAKDDYISLPLRASYQINRNNFVDIGYAFSQRAADSNNLQEYSRNRFDFGWRLRL